MGNPLGKLGVLVLITFLAACSTLDPNKKTVSIAGAIDVPLATDSETYWIDDGPLFIASRDPLITYRVIDKEELEFVGTNKSVYEFFHSSLSNPDGIVEESFLKSHDAYEIRRQESSGMDIFIMSKPNESKAYIVSRSLPIGLEILATGTNSGSILDEIIDDARLVKGD